MTTGEGGFDPVLARGTEAYIRYCGGLAVVQSPFETTGIHNQQDVDANVDTILAFGAEMMFQSVKKFVSIIHPQNSQKAARYSFEQNEPIMHRVLAYACEFEEPRLAEINVWYPVLRPAPFLHKFTYSNIMASRYERVKLPNLTDNFPVHEIFRNKSPYIERPADS